MELIRTVIDGGADDLSFRLNTRLDICLRRRICMLCRLFMAICHHTGFAIEKRHRLKKSKDEKKKKKSSARLDSRE